QARGSGRMSHSSHAGRKSEGTMPRRKAAVPRPKSPKDTLVATHLPEDAQTLHTVCSDGWANAKQNPQQISPPAALAQQMDEELKALGTALLSAVGGSEVEKETARSAAKKVRKTWGRFATYIEGILPGMAPADIPVLLASVHMSVSQVGKRKP